MIMPAVVFHIALGSAYLAGPENDVLKGRAFVTRVGQPFCADPSDFHSFFIGAISGNEVMGSTINSCSLFRYRRNVIVIRTLRDRNLLKVKVNVGRGFIYGYTTSAGLEKP